MKSDAITSADIRLAETLLGTRAADKDLSDIARDHLVSTYKRALAGETDAIGDLVRGLAATYTVAGSALVLCSDRSPEVALAQAADYHAAHADERHARPANE